MKNTVDAKAFSEALDKASRAIRRSQLPILEQALIRFSGDRCLLAGTDLESWITVEIPAQGDEFAFAFKRTKDISKICRLFDGELSFECVQADREDDVTVTLTCGPRKGAFAAYPAADFPEMPSPEGDVLFSADAANLLRRIERVDYATLDPSKCAKPACSSVHFRGNDVFTIDGNRVACDADASLDFPTPFLAPVRAMRHLKVFGPSQVEFRFWKSYGQVCNGTTSLYFHLPGGETFDLRRSLPADAMEELRVRPKEFLKELTYLSEVTAREKRPVAYFHCGRLTAPHVDGPFSTQVKTEGDCDTLFGFSISYMLDTLKRFSQEQWVTLKVGRSVTPFLVEAEGRSDFALICPVRLPLKNAA